MFRIMLEYVIYKLIMFHILFNKIYKTKPPRISPRGFIYIHNLNEVSAGGGLCCLSTSPIIVVVTLQLVKGVRRNSQQMPFGLQNCCSVTWSLRCFCWSATSPQMCFVLHHSLMLWWPVLISGTALFRLATIGVALPLCQAGCVTRLHLGGQRISTAHSPQILFQLHTQGSDFPFNINHLGIC